MPNLDITTLLNNMLDAAKASLNTKWPGVAGVATTTFKSLAQHLADIETMRRNGTITPEKAALLVDMQKNAVRIAMLTEEGLGLLAAEAAINAAMDAIRSTVNTAMGFVLI